ncbi:unnamed protein product [Aphanomyces euteiches]|uniref:FAD-binding FR-type domain-containing protein n=1 Tax=Aphanomyces euteiches TaxID=100861 RepID=A0A6G0WE51_9STRA|nr:hypothetical protein Ae201684_015960 [Aphanomyces euteiches]KAH9088341.1 hypothetical protein Ae201684P_003035 [Aphanomyces euteiches]KAH9097978.1 hypothetical protein LEN26_016831 [Aphanomyces euteiches]KAH9117061.1 hypothetical protein AeMF1_009063 [Aphanomyces euteiches]KAH9138273.1 hypothetical protein AeRB84_017394 [Aphanomyces euteiches]
MQRGLGFLPYALVEKTVLVDGDGMDPYKSIVQLTFSLGSPEATLGVGQPCTHLRIRLPDSWVLSKSYSIVSRPDERGVFRVVIKVYRGGLMSEYFDRLAINDSIYASKSLTKVLKPASHVGLIAFGIGITEMPVTAETLLAQGSQQVTLIHCIRYEREALFTADITALKAQFPTQFKVLYVVSQPRDDTNLEGMIAGRFNDSVIDTAFGQWDKTQARFLAIGTKAMKRTAYNLLTSHGFDLHLVERPSKLSAFMQAVGAE